MLHADLALARRLERTEGRACAQYAEARRSLFPDSTSTWMERAGAFVVFDGVESPVTQTFGLGMFEDASDDALDAIEAFFTSRGASTFHEVCPFAGTATLARLCARGYAPIEISSVMAKPVARVEERATSDVEVHAIAPAEVQTWTETSARGWSSDHPEFRDFLLDLGRLLTSRADTTCFLASVDGKPAGAGVLSIHEGTALFGGAATVPELRRRGAQSALLRARMQHAAARGCDVAMMVAEIGSKSQRNAEREGFGVAYTRTKWRREVRPGAH